MGSSLEALGFTRIFSTFTMRILNPAPTQAVSYDKKLLQKEIRIYILEQGNVGAWHWLVICTNETESQSPQAATRVSEQGVRLFRTSEMNRVIKHDN